MRSSFICCNDLHLFLLTILNALSIFFLDPSLAPLLDFKGMVSPIHAFVMDKVFNTVFSDSKVSHPHHDESFFYEAFQLSCAWAFLSFAKTEILGFFFSSFPVESCSSGHWTSWRISNESCPRSLPPVKHLLASSWQESDRNSIHLWFTALELILSFKESSLYQFLIHWHLNHQSVSKRCAIRSFLGIFIRLSWN